MTSSTTTERASHAPPTPLLHDRAPVRTMIWLLSAAGMVAAAGSLFLPGVLKGTAVIDGNLRGTAVVMLLVGLPLLLSAGRYAARGSVRGLILCLGAATYLSYQGVMLCFATPFNSLFPAYVGVLGLGVWTLVATLADIDQEELAASIPVDVPYRTVSAALAGFAMLNAAGWLARIVPAVLTGGQPAGIAGSGLLTSPVWVQDLAIWIPAAMISAILMWRRRPFGVLLTHAALTFYLIECLSVASDQWWGARADSSQPALASMAAVPGALLAAAAVALPLVWSMQRLGRA